MLTFGREWRATAAVTLGVRLGPVSARIEGLGLGFGVSSIGGTLDIRSLSLGLKPPTGLGVSLETGPVTGSGMLAFDAERKRYFGALGLEALGAELALEVGEGAQGVLNGFDVHSHRQEPASDEGHRQRRRLVQPLGIVDDTDEGLLLGSLREQAEDSQTDHEAVWRRLRAEPERRLECVTLRLGQSRPEVEHWGAELVQARVCELHLVLDTGRSRDSTPRRALYDVLQ